jgi:hypothetical protein
VDPASPDPAPPRHAPAARSPPRPPRRNPSARRNESAIAMSGSCAIVGFHDLCEPVAVGGGVCARSRRLVVRGKGQLESVRPLSVSSWWIEAEKT